MPKRIMFYLGYPQRLAGSQRQIISLICNLDRKRFKPVVVLPFQGVVGPYLKERGIEVETIKPEGLLATYGKRVLSNSKFINVTKGSLSYLSYNWKIRDFVKAFDIDLVHTAESRATLMIGPGVRLAGRKLVAHYQGEFPLSSTSYIVRLCKAMPNFSICNARFVQRSIFGDKNSPSIRTIYTGIEKPNQAGSINTLRWIERKKKEGVVFIGCFASVVPFKGYHVLLDAIQKLRGETKSKFIVVGIGGFPEGNEWYHDYLFDRIDEEKIRNFIFAGWHDAPYGFLDLMDITCLPSIAMGGLHYKGVEHSIRGNEGFPTTHLEAMSFSKPIIGTKIAGVPEQIAHNETGLLVDPSDATQLACAIKTLVDDPNLRQKLGKNGFNRTQSMFSINTYVSAVSAVYDGLLA